MTRTFITGVNRGIGAALAAEASARGHDVIGTSRDGADQTLPLSLGDPAQVAAQLAGRIDGAVDIVINNAGVIGPARQSTLDMDWAGFADALAINTLAPLAVAQTLLPNLRQSRSPKIITVSSQMSWMGYAKSDRIAYRASKAAVNKVMQGLATDLEPDGIAVLLVDPGWVRTDMGGQDAAEDPADVARGILDIADRVNLSDTGKFFRFTGEERPF
ncbi:MAG: SDR family NAD(P)-dependent oxidoreductase [Pseudomonadota bacterium]